MQKKINMFLVGFSLCIVFFITWLNIYMYEDCKKVGHTTFYCVMRIGK